MKKTLLTLSVLLLVIFSSLALADNVQITLGKNSFCIPKHYSILNQVSSPLFNIKGTDSGYGGSFQVAIDPFEVKQSMVVPLVLMVIAVIVTIHLLEIDGYLVKIRTTENNLHMKEQITEFSKKLLVLWQQACKTG